MNKIVNKILLGIGLFITIPCVKAETISLDEVPLQTYVIGNYMFTRDKTENYDGQLKIEYIMLAAKSIDGNTLDDMVIYFKTARGKWVDGVSGTSITPPSTFEITNSNLSQITPSAPIVSYSSGTGGSPQLIHGFSLSNIPEGSTKYLEIFYATEENGEYFKYDELVVNGSIYNSKVNDVYIETSRGLSGYFKLRYKLSDVLDATKYVYSDYTSPIKIVDEAPINVTKSGSDGVMFTYESGSNFPGGANNNLFDGMDVYIYNVDSEDFEYTLTISKINFDVSMIGKEYFGCYFKPFQIIGDNKKIYYQTEKKFYIKEPNLSAMVYNSPVDGYRKMRFGASGNVNIEVEQEVNGQFSFLSIHTKEEIKQNKLIDEMALYVDVPFVANKIRARAYLDVNNKRYYSDYSSPVDVPHEDWLIPLNVDIESNQINIALDTTVDFEGMDMYYLNASTNQYEYGVTLDNLSFETTISPYSYTSVYFKPFKTINGIKQYYQTETYTYVSTPLLDSGKYEEPRNGYQKRKFFYPLYGTIGVKVYYSIDGESYELLKDLTPSELLENSANDEDKMGIIIDVPVTASKIKAIGYIEINGEEIYSEYSNAVPAIMNIDDSLYDISIRGENIYDPETNKMGVYLSPKTNENYDGMDIYIYDKTLGTYEYSETVNSLFYKVLFDDNDFVSLYFNLFREDNGQKTYTRTKTFSHIGLPYLNNFDGEFYLDPSVTNIGYEVSTIHSDDDNWMPLYTLDPGNSVYDNYLFKVDIPNEGITTVRYRTFVNILGQKIYSNNYIYEEVEKYVYSENYITNYSYDSTDGNYQTFKIVIKDQNNNPIEANKIDVYMYSSSLIAPVKIDSINTSEYYARAKFGENTRVFFVIDDNIRTGDALLQPDISSNIDITVKAGDVEEDNVIYNVTYNRGEHEDGVYLYVSIANSSLFSSPIKLEWSGETISLPLAIPKVSEFTISYMPYKIVDDVEIYGRYTYIYDGAAFPEFTYNANYDTETNILYITPNYPSVDIADGVYYEIKGEEGLYRTSEEQISLYVNPDEIISIGYYKMVGDSMVRSVPIEIYVSEIA